MTGQRQRTVDTPQRCHYATDPTSRPRCTLTATVRYGDTVLCRPCDARRSTVGKGQPPIRLPDAGPVDVLDWVDTAHKQLTAAEHALTVAITRARQRGHSWAAIGQRLGTTRQAAQQRFTRAHARAGARSSRHGGANSS